MNCVTLMGRLTKNPTVNYTQGANQICVARYTLAVDRRFRQEGVPQADFISCVAFGKAGEFAEKYLQKGTKIAVRGRIQTGSYTNREGVKVYTTDIIVEEQEFAESKSSGSSNQCGNSGQSHQNPQNGYQQSQTPVRPDPAYAEEGFMSIPDNIADELPFI